MSPFLSSVCQTLLSSVERDLNSTTFNRGQTNGLVSGLHQRNVSGLCHSDHIIITLLSKGPQ